MNEIKVLKINLLNDSVFFHLREIILECDCEPCGNNEYVSEFDVEFETPASDIGAIVICASGKYIVSGRSQRHGDEQEYFQMTGRWMNNIDVTGYLNGEEIEILVNGLDIAKEIERQINE